MVSCCLVISQVHIPRYILPPMYIKWFSQGVPSFCTLYHPHQLLRCNSSPHHRSIYLGIRFHLPPMYTEWFPRGSPSFCMLYHPHQPLRCNSLTPAYALNSHINNLKTSQLRTKIMSRFYKKQSLAYQTQITSRLLKMITHSRTPA